MSERKNYRETPVRGTDLVMRSWSAGARVMTNLSWPPHGIDRPIEIALTLSDAEVDILAAASRSTLTTEAARLLLHIGDAVLVQCGVLRTMQEHDPQLTILPATGAQEDPR